MGIKMRKEKSRPETLSARFIQRLMQVFRLQLPFEEPYSNKEFCQETLNHAEITLSFTTAHTGFFQTLPGFTAQHRPLGVSRSHL